MKLTRKNLVEDRAFRCAYGCAAHALGNFARDALKLSDAQKVFRFCCSVVKIFTRSHKAKHALDSMREKEEKSLHP